LKNEVDIGQRVKIDGLGKLQILTSSRIGKIPERAHEEVRHLKFSHRLKTNKSPIRET